MAAGYGARFLCKAALAQLRAQSQLLRKLECTCMTAIMASSPRPRAALRQRNWPWWRAKRPQACRALVACACACTCQRPPEVQLSLIAALRRWCWRLHAMLDDDGRVVRQILPMLPFFMTSSTSCFIASRSKTARVISKSKSSMGMPPAAVVSSVRLSAVVWPSTCAIASTARAPSVPWPKKPATTCQRLGQQRVELCSCVPCCSF